MISKPYLRALIESVLLESYKSDQRYLAEKYPAHAKEVDKLQSKWVAWLMDRFGESPSQPESSTFEEALAAISSYAPRDAAMGEKYRTNDWWRGQVDAAFPDKVWSSPADPTAMTVSDMLELVKLSKLKKPRIEVDRSQGFSGDLVGAVGPWEIFEPSSRENSCNIVGINKETGKPNTDWCTARTDASNLFYNYVALYNMFTLVHQGNVPTRQKWVSIALNDDGTVEYEGVPGEHPTVDGENDLMNEMGLKRMLGAEFDGVMEVLRGRLGVHGGVSPAREKIRDAARDAQSFNHIMQGISKTEATSLKQQGAKVPGSSSDIAQLLADDPEWRVKHMLAQNKDIPVDIIEKLSRDDNVEVRQRIAKNEATPPEILARLTKDKEVVQYVVMNPHAPPETLASLADVSFFDRVLGRTDRDLLKAIGKNPSTPVKTLQNLAKNSDYYIRLGVAQNRAAPASLIRQLANDENSSVRTSVAYNKSTDISIVRELANDKDGSVALTAREELRKRGMSESRLRNLIRQMI